MTNEVAQVMQSHYWGIGSEWLWAFGQFVVVAVTLGFIAAQVWIQTKQTKIQTMSHVVQSVCTIQERCIQKLCSVSGMKCVTSGKGGTENLTEPVNTSLAFLKS